MKKLLALVLALVMVLGLATVSTSAAYSDQDDINYEEAVDVMTAVGVFQGKGDAFAPKDNLNRAEAAKLIAYLMLGNKTAESMQGAGSKFTDVPASHWAAGFIEYLASVGVVSGVGDNKFDPNGQVTSVQFAKMLLVALGYDAGIEGFVGEGWSINIQKVANQNDLYSGLDIVANAPLNREQAAQMCLNDLKADMVEYEDKGTTVNVGGATVITGVKNAKEVEEKSNNNYNGAERDDSDYKYRQLAEELYGSDLKLDKKGSDDFGRPANKWTYKNEDVGTYDSRDDLLGTYTAKLTKAVLYDLVGKSVYDNLVDTDDDAKLTIYEDGRKIVNAIEGENNIKGYIDRDNTAKIGKNAVGEKTGNGTLTQVYKDDDDNVTVVIINTYIYQASSDYRASSETLVIETPDDADLSVNLESTTLDLDDFEQIKDYKEDDYLLITAYDTDGNGIYTVDSVKKAELLTGNVDSVVVSDSVTIDGTKKSYSAKASDDTKDPGYSVGQDATVVLDAYGYIIYVDEAVVNTNYVFIADIGSTSSINSKVVADAYFTDGTNHEITIKEIDGSSTKSNMVKAAGGTSLYHPNKNTAADGKTVPKFSTGLALGTGETAGVGVLGNKLMAGWYTFSKNSAGEYSLYSLSDSYAQNVGYAGENNLTTDKPIAEGGKVSFLSNLTGLTSAYFAGIDAGNINSAKANDKTIFVVVGDDGDDDDVKVYTGVKNLPDIQLIKETNTDASPKTVQDDLHTKAGKLDGGQAVVFAAVKSSSGYADYVFVALTGNNSVYGAESEALKYFIKHDKTNKTTDNETYETYKMLDENAKEITVESEKKLAGFAGYQSYYKTSVNSDGRYTRATLAPTKADRYFNQAGTSLDYNNGTLTFTGAGGDGKFATTGTSFVLADNYKLVVVSKVAALNKDKGADYEANIMTASGLKALLNGYTDVEFTVQGRTKDTCNLNGKDELIEAYVTITKATNPVATWSITKKMTDGTSIDAITSSAKVVFTGSSTVAKNASYNFTVAPAANYAIGAVKYAMGGNTYTLGTGAGNYTIPSVTGDVTVTVTYTAPIQVKLLDTAGAMLDTDKVNVTAQVGGVSKTYAGNADFGTNGIITVAAGSTVRLIVDAIGTNYIASAKVNGIEDYYSSTQYSFNQTINETTEIKIGLGTDNSKTLTLVPNQNATVRVSYGSTSEVLALNKGQSTPLSVEKNGTLTMTVIAWELDNNGLNTVYTKKNTTIARQTPAGGSYTFTADSDYEIGVGAPYYTVTVKANTNGAGAANYDGADLLSWMAASAAVAYDTGTASIASGKANVPQGATVMLKSTQPTHFAQIVTSGLTADGTVVLDTNNTAKTLGTFTGTADKSIDLTVTTAEVKVLTSLIGAGTLTNNGTPDVVTTVAQGANTAKFADATAGYTYFNTANTAALNVTFTIQCSATATATKNINVEEKTQGVTVVDGNATNMPGISSTGKLVSGGNGRTETNTEYTIPLALKTAGQTIGTLRISLGDWAT